MLGLPSILKFPSSTGKFNLANVQALVELGEKYVAAGDLESLTEVANEAQSQALQMTSDEQLLLREAVSRWIAGATLLRAEYLCQLQRCQSASDARKTYQSVSTAE